MPILARILLVFVCIFEFVLVSLPKLKDMFPYIVGIVNVLLAIASILVLIYGCVGFTLYIIGSLFFKKPKNTYDPLSSSLLTCLLLGMMASSDTKTEKSKSLTDNKQEKDTP